MEAMEERKVWQRVRGTDRTERVRQCLAQQAELLRSYRQLARRGGKCLRLLEQKENQVACLRGILRVLTGQGAAIPKGGPVSPDLMRCYKGETAFLQELTELAQDPELGPVFESMRDRQKTQCRILLEVMGTM